MPKDEEITFYNITVTLPLGTDPNARARAYAHLVNKMAEITAKWSTDSYATSTMSESEPTETLWG